MIRHACFGDIPECLEWIKQANDRSEHYGRTVNERKVHNDLMERIMNPFALVLLGNGGLLVAIAVESYFGGMKTANEFFYAEKGGLSLLRAYKYWAKGWGPETMIDACLSFGDNERVQKLFEREGFRTVGPQMRLVSWQL